jgi:hypothetical protein
MKIEKLKLGHLTREQHQQLARLLNVAQDNLKNASCIVHRAPYSDTTLRVSRAVQERLIDQLRAAWDEEYEYHDNPYQSVGYWIGGKQPL